MGLRYNVGVFDWEVCTIEDDDGYTITLGQYLVHCLWVEI